MNGNTIRRLFESTAEALRQLLLLARETLSVRYLLLNRVVVVLAIIVLSVVAGQAYVGANDGGALHGTVVDESGDPVANATVRMEVRGIVNVVRTMKTTTDADGRFAFTDYSGGTGGTSGLELVFRVTTADGDRTPPQPRHAYFPNQNMAVRLVVGGATG